MKRCNTTDLLHLNGEARRLGLNRQLDPDALDRLVDPGGWHVLSPVLVHDDDHVRCAVYVKLVNQEVPAMGFLDVTLDQFNGLIDAEAAAQ
jgi:hypothetical protein